VPGARETAALAVVGSGERFESIDESPASRMPSYVRVDARLRYDISKTWKPSCTP